MQTLFGSREGRDGSWEEGAKAGRRTEHAVLRARTRQRLDQFAYLISEGMSTADAAERLGLKPESGKGLLRQIRKGLGWQAQ